MNKRASKDAARNLLNMTVVEEIMSAPVKTLNAGAMFSEVEKAFLELGIRHLPIVDISGKIVGIITQKDLYKLISPRKVVAKTLEYDGDKILDGDAYYSREVLDTYVLRHVMTKNVCTLGLNSTIGEAANSIVSNDVSSVVIVNEEEKVLGIITTHDIMKAVDRIFLGEK